MRGFFRPFGAFQVIKGPVPHAPVFGPGLRLEGCRYCSLHTGSGYRPPTLSLERRRILHKLPLQARIRRQKASPPTTSRMHLLWCSPRLQSLHLSPKTRPNPHRLQTKTQLRAAVLPSRTTAVHRHLRCLQWRPFRRAACLMQVRRRLLEIRSIRRKICTRSQSVPTWCRFL